MFYRVQNHEAQPSGFRHNKTCAASFLKASKTLLEKCFTIGFITINYAFENVGN